jgi:hypothetical protein
MKLQYEILSIGLKDSIIAINQEDICSANEDNESHPAVNYIPESAKGCYFKFSTFFVDDKENLKDVMQ